MDILWWLPFSGFILACSVGMIVWHVRSWRAQRAAGLDAKEFRYRRRQFRRRMQSSIMLALVAATLPAGVWILPLWPKIGVFVWGAVLLLLVWVGILGIADIWDTKYFYGKLRDGYRLEQTRLRAELRRLRSEGGPRPAPTRGGNGKPPKRFPGAASGDQGPQQ